MAKTAYTRVTTPTTAEEREALTGERTALATQQQYLQEWEEKFKEPPAPEAEGPGKWLPYAIVGGALLVLGGLVWWRRR
jgi:MYXO-CTERM domain-containing protein